MEERYILLKSCFEVQGQPTGPLRCNLRQGKAVGRRGAKEIARGWDLPVTGPMDGLEVQPRGRWQKKREGATRFARAESSVAATRLKAG
jgi:hypothetical protein